MTFYLGIASASCLFVLIAWLMWVRKNYNPTPGKCVICHENPADAGHKDCTSCYLE